MSRLWGGLSVVLAAFILMTFAFGQADLEGAKDYPGISRMPGYYINDYRDTPFDSYVFKVTSGKSWKEQTVEGHRYDFRYNLKDGVQAPSQLQVVRNFQNAARANGGKVLYDTPEETTISFNKDGNDVWLSIEVANAPSGTFIKMTIIDSVMLECFKDSCIVLL